MQHSVQCVHSQPLVPCQQCSVDREAIWSFLIFDRITGANIGLNQVSSGFPVNTHTHLNIFSARNSNRLWIQSLLEITLSVLCLQLMVLFMRVVWRGNCRFHFCTSWSWWTVISKYWKFTEIDTGRLSSPINKTKLYIYSGSVRTQLGENSFLNMSKVSFWILDRLCLHVCVVAFKESHWHECNEVE